jgi:crossover junction endodeoxyribonuclease RuvC
MIVMGVDPGSRNTGYGLIRFREEGPAVVGCGLIRMKGTTPLIERIGTIWKGLEEVVASSRPDCIAIETAFVGRNARSALILGQVRGAVLALAARSCIPVREYAPREVKIAVTGSGSASKEQVAFMLSRLLGISGESMPADVTDALGIAWCDLSRHAAGEGASIRRDQPCVGRKKKQPGWSAFVDDHPELVA